MKKTYQRPGIWVEKLKMESLLPSESLNKQVTRVTGADLKYVGGGSEDARSGESNLWDEEVADPEWDH